MSQARPQLSVTDMRGATRHRVEYPVIAEHRRLGDLKLRIANLSARGFMTAGPVELDRGERLSLRLPVIGRIEAHLVWCEDGRAGFQFERVIRPCDFLRLMEAIVAAPDARPRGKLARPDRRPSGPHDNDP